MSISSAADQPYFINSSYTGIGSSPNIPIITSYSNNTVGGAITNSGNVTISGDLWVGGNIRQGIGPEEIPEYSREWALRTMIKITRAEVEIGELKRYISLLERKLDAINSPI